MKCEGCKKEKLDIKNYVVKYESWEAYNCCCKKCAKRKALEELPIESVDDIFSVE